MNDRRLNPRLHAALDDFTVDCPRCNAPIHVGIIGSEKGAVLLGCIRELIVGALRRRSVESWAETVDGVLYESGNEAPDRPTGEG